MNKMVLILMFFCSHIVMSQQLGDNLYWEQDTLIMYASPLHQYEKIDSLNEFVFKKQEVNTACWRGYRGVWKLIDSNLFLTQILDCNKVSDLVTINKSIRASWVTGTHLVFKGKGIHYGDEPVYEKELELIFNEGKLIAHQEYDNSKSYKSVYTTKLDSLQRFIYQKINWEKIPDLGDQTSRVVITLYSGNTPKPDSIQVVRKSEYSFLNKEALRVVKLIPEWDVYYRRGKVVYKKWIIPVIFDEKTRKKYSQ